MTMLAEVTIIGSAIPESELYSCNAITKVFLIEDVLVFCIQSNLVDYVCFIYVFTFGCFFY